MNPAPCAACGFSLLFLPPIIHVFLSFPVTAHIPAWLAIVPFPMFLSSCRLLHVSGHHSLGTLLCPPPPLLSVRSSLPPVDPLHPFLRTLCPAFSLLSTSFPLGTGQHIPLFHVPPLPSPCPLSGLSGGGSRGAGCEKAPPSRAPAPGLAPLRPSEPTMAVPPGHGPFSGFPGPQEHTQVRVPLAPHLPGGGGGWDRRVLGPKKMMWLPGTVCRA